MKDILRKENISEKAVRLYINKGLLHPLTIEQNGRNNFSFSEEDIKILEDIILLRTYDFSLQEIKAILEGTDEICKQTFLQHGKCLKKQNLVYKAWEKIPWNQIKKENREIILKELRENYEKTAKEHLLTLHFEESNSDDFGVPNRTWRKYLICMIVFCFIAGITIGGIWTAKWSSERQRMKYYAEEFSYGITENALVAQEILWNEFPSFRKAQFALSGSFSINLPTNESLIIAELEDQKQLAEVSRENLIFSDGKGIHHYDLVTYQIKNGIICSNNIQKFYGDDIKRATQGYLLQATAGDTAYSLGYILPGADFFTAWTLMEEKYYGRNYAPYMGGFHLSRTYDDSNHFSVRKEADDIELIHSEGEVLNYTIYNKGEEGWYYSEEMPALELWYNGVWLELEDGIDNGLIEYCLSPGTQKKVFPKDVMDNYPDCIPGIYRLVVYGREDCAISDSFCIK